MTLDDLLKAVLSIGTPLATVIGVGGRRSRLRRHIRENVAVLKLIDEDPGLSQHTPARGWLEGRIAVDVAKLAGQPLGTPKKPIPVGSLIFSVVVAVVFGAWTYFLDVHGFVWYSVFPALVSLLMLIAILGMTTNRELPESETAGLPPGATPARSGAAGEEFAASVRLAASGADTTMFTDQGQVGTAMRFVELMRLGRYLDAISLAEDNWLLCRVQSWLWNLRQAGAFEHVEEPTLRAMAHELVSSHSPQHLWDLFVESETTGFVQAWVELVPDRLGAASQRRRIAPDLDLVLLTLLGPRGGYFVATATALPDAIPFLMRRSPTGWRVVNHLAGAPPMPGLPPVWWNVNDPAIVALPDGADNGDAGTYPEDARST